MVNKHGNFKHGLINHLIYKIWFKIKRRCYNPNHILYKYYGARGIKVYPPWTVDFMLFYEYTISLPNYDEKKLGRKGGLTLDRIDNEGNYEPGNLRWTGFHNQSANRRVFKNNKTGYTGVSLIRTLQKYVSYIAIKGIRYHLGYYNTIEEAVEIRNQYIINHNLLEYPLQKIIKQCH